MNALYRRQTPLFACWSQSVSLDFFAHSSALSFASACVKVSLSRLRTSVHIIRIKQQKTSEFEAFVGRLGLTFPFFLFFSFSYQILSFSSLFFVVNSPLSFKMQHLVQISPTSKRESTKNGEMRCFWQINKVFTHLLVNTWLFSLRHKLRSGKEEK